MSCNFMSCNFDGPSFSCPSFSVNPFYDEAVTIFSSTTWAEPDRDGSRICSFEDEGSGVVTVCLKARL